MITIDVYKRQIRTSLSAYILCILIVAIGLCGYSVLGLCYDNMVLSRDTFFRNTDYCYGFADTADTDLRAASRLEGLDGCLLYTSFGIPGAGSFLS